MSAEEPLALGTHEPQPTWLFSTRSRPTQPFLPGPRGDGRGWPHAGPRHATLWRPREMVRCPLLAGSLLQGQPRGRLPPSSHWPGPYLSVPTRPGHAALTLGNSNKRT